MKSLKVKIMVTIGGVAILMMLLSAYFTITTVNRNSIKTEEFVASLCTEVVIGQLDEYFTKYIAITEQVANDTSLRRLAVEAENAEAMQAHPLFQNVFSTLKTTTDRDSKNILATYFVTVGNNIGLDGAGWIPDSSFDLTSRDYWFSDAKDIERGYIISSPYQDSDTGNMVITISAPLYGYGANEDSLVGVAAIDVTINDVSDMVVNSNSSYEGAYKMLITQEGVILGAENKDLLLKNVSEAGFSQEMLDKIQNPDGDVIPFEDKGEPCFGTVKETDKSDWKVAYVVPKDEFMAATGSTKRTLLGVYAIAIVLLYAVMTIVVRNVVKPLRKLTVATDQLAAGNLEATIDICSKDETGRLADSMRSLVNRLREYIAYIDEISQALDKFADGYLEIELKHSYDGEFAKIKASLLQVSGVFKDTIGQIVETSDKVANGSGEIADAAQLLAQGAANQASTTEELTATINELSARVGRNAQHAGEAAKQAKIVGEEANNSNSQMKEMISSIAEINSKSSEISKIIKAIEDIAFQTNILALNAAVEAARAGEAGKGFAVVADEVRNLASKSAEAAQNTTHLIEETVKAVENGTNIANRTGEMLEKVMEGVTQTVGLISEISDASADEAVTLNQTLEAVEQISMVVQTNAATAEESSAASTELSSQAGALQEVAGRFKL